MIYKYKVQTQSETIEGACAAESEQQAVSIVLKKIAYMKGEKVLVTINNKTTELERKVNVGYKLFAKPVARKVDNRPKLPWH